MYGTVTEQQARALNAQYIKASQTSAGRDKISAGSEDQLESYLKETCRFDMILEPKDVPMDKLEVGTDNDTMYLRVHLTFETRAYLSTFESVPVEVQEVYIPRLFLSFYMLNTPTYVINDYHAMAYPFPIAAQVEESLGMTLQEAKEWSMLRTLEEGLQAGRSTLNNIIMGKEAQDDYDAEAVTNNKARGANNADATRQTPFRGKIHRLDITTIKEYYSERRTRLDKVLLTEKDYLGIERHDASQMGDILQSQVFQEGYQADRLGGVTFIRTIKIDTTKGDVFRPGNIYAFASGNEIGRNYTLRGIKLFADRKRQFLSFDAQMAIGHLWGVTSKMAKVELYNGGLNPSNTALNKLDATTPASDSYWNDPSLIMEKDYYNYEDELRRPLIKFQ